MNGKGKNKKTSSYKERKAISYQQGSDPPFLAQFKSKVGYKEWTVEDKFAKSDDEEEEEGANNPTDDIRKMREEERPQVVVLDPRTDLSAEELQKEIEKGNEEEDKRKIMEGKIVFRKPEKRKTENESGKEGSKEEEEKKRAKKEEKPTQKEQNRRLLSFGEEDE
ncbi:hypothetical protein niasHT_005682 [Heterodera trifolii]|uniref:DUF4604 domain-containing protein n=1 Tax=Heterodera trifolii TaxID=157864 RepID=A0ABD2MB92_9BILA